MSDLNDALNSLQNGISGIIGDAKENPGAVLASAVGGAVLGSVLTGAAVMGASALKASSGSSSRKRRKKITHTKRGWKADRARRSKQKWEVAYQKKKRKAKRKAKKAHHRRGARSKKGIHYTKNGQPYKILSSGKARFIKRRR